MIDYIIISLAVVCFALQFAFTKLYEGAVKQTTLTALIMLIETSLIGTVLFLLVGGFSVQISVSSLIYAAIFATVMIPYYMIGIKVLSLGSLAIYSMFMMLGGMRVPFFYGVWFLNESLSVSKIIGTVLLCLFIIVQSLSQNSGENRSENKKSILFITLCLLIFFINGATGVIAKAHQISSSPVDEISFTVISCALTAIFSALMLPFFCLKNKDEPFFQIKSVLKTKPIIIMSMIGAAAYTGNFLHLKAASAVPASVQFPLVSGGVIVLSALVSAFIFKEKLSLKEWISVIGVCASTVLFAF